jgi:phosphate transport system permease protein
MTNQEQKINNIPLYVTIISKSLSTILGISGLTSLIAALLLFFTSNINISILQSLQGQNDILYGIAFLVIAVVLGLIAKGFWNYKNWAKTIIIAGLLIFIIYSFINVIFAIFTAIFAGESIVPMISILQVVGQGLLFFLSYAILPGGLIYLLIKIDQYYKESPQQREFVDSAIRYVLLGTALSCIIIVFLIFLFTMEESVLAIEEIGIGDMLTGTIWRPGSIIGTEDAQFGLLPMILGSILATFGAILLGVPLSVGTAILLAEVAPRIVRETVRPAIELLAGIPSVVYGLFGMVVLAPLIRNIEVPRNTGFGLLNASIVLAVMIIPTITNITEDAIRAVPREYKEGSLALGGTHWQTIIKVILPAARSGIIAAVILGVGRALGETMAMIMVIGNSIAMPEPLTNNPLTIFLNTARTLTGNIAVEINYAAGVHRSALFFTGVLLFIMIMLVNSTARFFMKSSQGKQ